MKIDLLRALVVDPLLADLCFNLTTRDFETYLLLQSQVGYQTSEADPYRVPLPPFFSSISFKIYK